MEFISEQEKSTAQNSSVTPIFCRLCRGASDWRWIIVKEFPPNHDEGTLLVQEGEAYSAGPKLYLFYGWEGFSV